MQEGHVIAFFLVDNVCMYVSYSLNLLSGSCYAAHINV